MNIGDADVLLTDLIADAQRNGVAHAKNIFQQMLDQTRRGQTWAIIVPAAFLEGITLPQGLTVRSQAELPPLGQPDVGSAWRARIIMGVVEEV